MKDIVLKGGRALKAFGMQTTDRTINIPIQNSDTEIFDELQIISSLVDKCITPSDTAILIEKEIKKKRSAYKRQDIKKEILDEEKLISYSDILILLKNSNLKCNFCKINMKILYKKLRDPQQWTLDRIDNNLGHNIGNVEIVCLKCNLDRRRIEHDAYKWTKELTIKKE